jgi:anti-anti-sigma factor
MSVERVPRFERSVEPSGTLTFTVTELESTVLVRIAGEIDRATIHQLMVAVEGVDLDRISLLVVDLQDVAFLDLAAINTILRVKDECDLSDVHLTVIAPRGSARRVFTLTRVHELLDFVDTRIGDAR